MTCMLLLPKLVQIWLPDDSAARRQSPPSDLAPRSEIPPLISFLEGLPDILTPDKYRGKLLPCGHAVSVCSVLSLVNLLGEATWNPGRHTMSCAQPECNESVEFPQLPNPQTLDGLEARLDLIQYSWNKDPPTELDMNLVSLLRDMLSRIGNSSNRDPDSETDLEPSQSAPSEASLMQTLTHMEMDSLMVLNQEKSAETPLRGNQPYCSYRETVIPTPGQSLRYNMASPGQCCECVTPHDYERHPSAWALTPAETEVESGAEKPEKLKKVRFVASVVTKVQYFECWWNEEYRDSGRYYSTGPHRRSIDTSTKADDDWAIKLLDSDSEGSDCSTIVDADKTLDELDTTDEPLDEETLEGKEKETVLDTDKILGKLDITDESSNEQILEEIERANESWDDEILQILEEAEGANESWDAETMEDLRMLHGSSEEWF